MSCENKYEVITYGFTDLSEINIVFSSRELMLFVITSIKENLFNVYMLSVLHKWTLNVLSIFFKLWENIDWSLFLLQLVIVSLSQTLSFESLYLCCRPLIFKNINSVRSNNLSFKYQRCIPSGCKDMGNTKFEIVANTQFFCFKTDFISFVSSDLPRCPSCPMFLKI